MKYFIPLLAITFIALKLLGLVTWSWWLVFAPLWATAIFFVVCFFVGLFLVVWIGGSW